MPNPMSPRNQSFRKEWLRRLDRAAGDLNVLLVVFAIGLALLNVTFLASQRAIEHLPPVTRAAYAQQKAPPHLPPDQRVLPLGLAAAPPRSQFRTNASAHRGTKMATIR